MSSKVKVDVSGVVEGDPCRVVSAGGVSCGESWVRDDCLSIPDVAFGALVLAGVFPRVGIPPKDVVADLAA